MVSKIRKLNKMDNKTIKHVYFKLCYKYIGNTEMIMLILRILATAGRNVYAGLLPPPIPPPRYTARD